MYELLRVLHNLLRWLVLGGMIWALVVIYRDLFGGAAWTERHRKAGVIYTAVLGLQLLLGLLLYFIGPYSVLAINDLGTAVQDAVLRFFALEHPVQMILAVIIAQVGYSVSKRASTDKAKFRWAAICYTLAAVLILISIPWPFLEHGRPLLPYW